jgi:hypothetical protein
MTEKYKRPTMEELTASLEKAKAESKAAICELMDYNDMMDDDGYPTDAALNIIEMWHWSDAKGWFSFIESIWHLRSWGWSEGTQPDEYNPGEWVYLYNISTAGWSGNEEIIRAMQNNEMMWHLNWVQSRRGGHYIFELKEFGDE